MSGQAFSDLLRRKFENPMLGFYAGYLLRGSDAEEIDTLEEVVKNLAMMIEPPPGLLHPDLEALRLRLKLLRKEQIDETLELPLPPCCSPVGGPFARLRRIRAGWFPRGWRADRISSRLVTAGASMTWIAAEQVVEASVTEAVAGPRTVSPGPAAVRRRGIHGISAGGAAATIAPPAEKPGPVLYPGARHRFHCQRVAQ